MQAIISAVQMHLADEYTINHEPVTSFDLMERASAAFVKCFKKDFDDRGLRLAVFCGHGNNGGDGLAIARMLINSGYLNTAVYKINFSPNQSEDNKTNEALLKKMHAPVRYIYKAEDMQFIAADVLIDAVLGSGLNKPLSGEYAQLAQNINSINIPVYAVDIPTGLPADGGVDENYNGIRAQKTITFQRPKFNFFLPESLAATQEFEVVNIGLDEDYIQSLPADHYLLEEKDIRKNLPPRKRFSHKGTYGHALLICGQPQAMGAALLCASGCIHAGAGLVTACIPGSGLTALNASLPEAMYLPRDIGQITSTAEDYKVVAIGCGLDTNDESKVLLEKALEMQTQLVIDADAINLLAKDKNLLDKLPPGTILTPHIKEFDRLFGNHTSWHSRLQTAVGEASSRKLTIVLKNQYTFICHSDKKIYINPTGNPAMAQGGMGDVLTGIIAGLLAQKLSPLHAAWAGCYLHGKAGDRLARNSYVVKASALAEQVSKEMK